MVIGTVLGLCPSQLMKQMCKGFHHCLSPWWWECSIRNRQLGDKQVDQTNYTNTNITSGRRASAVNTWKRQKASGSMGQIGMFQLLEWPSGWGWGRTLSNTYHLYIVFCTSHSCLKGTSSLAPSERTFFFFSFLFSTSLLSGTRGLSDQGPSKASRTRTT